MATRFRSLRFRTKVAIIVSTLFVLVAVMSYTMKISVCYPPYRFFVGKGGFTFLVYTGKVMNQGIFVSEALDIVWLPYFFSEPTRNYWMYFGYIPAWCIAPFVFIPTFLLWRKDRRIPEGHCKNCGYNLTGNVSGKCSECGNKIEAK